MALNTIPNKGLTNQGYPSDRIVTPLIINGDMAVAQRGTSETGFGTAQKFVTDRFRNQPVYGSTAPTARFTITQSTTVPTGQGFFNSLKWDCTTAQSSLTSDTGFTIEQRLEGQNVQSIKKGTSNAEKITMAFWVRSNKTGTYICEIVDGDNTRHCSKSYTISSANTWEKKIINFPADTTGAFDNDNATSLKLRIWLAAGSDFTGGTLATSFASVTNANTAVGQVNLADSTDNEFYLTGVQMEVGEFDSTSIPSFPFESFENNLRKCQRYYKEIIRSLGSDTQIAPGTMYTSTDFYGILFLGSGPMRATPTITGSTGSNIYGVTGGGNSQAANSLTFAQITNGASPNTRVHVGSVGSKTQGHGQWVRFESASSTSDFISADAEL